MRITFVARSTTFPSGGVLAVFELANAMERRGHDVTLIHLPNFTMHDAAWNLDQLTWCEFEPGITHRFDLQHMQDPPEMDQFPEGDFILWYHRDIPAFCGRPLMLVQGNLVKNQWVERVLAPVAKVCIAKWLRQRALSAGVPEGEVTYVPNGIRHSKYRVVVPVEGRPRRVAMLFNSHPMKGAKEGFRALQKVKARVPDTQAVVFGTKDRPDLPDWIEYRQCPSQDEIVSGVYNGSSVFLQSSIEEGFGLTATEAMACGCALVTTANGGSDEYAIDDESALVAPPRDVDGLADRIVALLTDDALRLRIAKRGTDLVRQFDWDVSARMLEEFLEVYGSAGSP